MVVFSFQLHLRCRRSEASFSFASKKMSFLRAHRAQTSRFPQERGWTSCSLLAVPLTFAPPSRPFWVGSSWGMASSFLLKLCPILGLYLYGAVLPPLGPNAGQQQVERSELQHAERRPLQPAPRGTAATTGAQRSKKTGVWAEIWGGKRTSAKITDRISVWGNIALEKTTKIPT